MGKCNVLIIEDEVGYSDLLKKKLWEQGYDVSLVSTGERAVEQVELISPDIVILDIILPGKDGYTILDELRKNEKTKDQKIVILSNLNENSKSLRALKELGVLDYIVKTDISLRDMVKKIRGYCEKNIERA